MIPLLLIAPLSRRAHSHRYAPNSNEVVGTRVLTKGASEQVVELCGSHLRTDGTTVVWGDANADALAEAKSEAGALTKHDQIEKLKKDAILPFASKMLRTFAVCYKDLDIMPDVLYHAVGEMIGCACMQCPVGAMARGFGAIVPGFIRLHGVYWACLSTVTMYI